MSNSLMETSPLHITARIGHVGVPQSSPQHGRSAPYAPQYSRARPPCVDDGLVSVSSFFPLRIFCFSMSMCAMLRAGSIADFTHTTSRNRIARLAYGGDAISNRHL